MNIVQRLGYQPTVYVSDGHGYDPETGAVTPGKRTPRLPNGKVIYENQFNAPTAKKFADLAAAAGFRVVHVSPENTDTPLEVRSDRANADYAQRKAQLGGVPSDKVGVYISFHYNAGSGVLDSNKGGVETHYQRGSASGQRLAECIQAELVKGTAQPNRGIKPNNLHETRETAMPAALVEAGFMDNLADAMRMLSDEFQLEVATETLRGVHAYYGLEYVQPKPKNSTPILAAASANVYQAQAWAKANNAPQEFINLAPLYWELAPKCGGVDPVVGYVQFAHETGFLYRDGRSSAGLDASYCNPCGLKVTQGGGDYEANAHKRFKDWREGITAHLDHAALYAGAPGYPKAGTPDPRHFAWIAGKAKTVEELGGKWAPSPSYGDKLLAGITQLRATKAEVPKKELPPQGEVFVEVNGVRVLNGSLEDGVTRVPLRAIVEMIPGARIEWNGETMTASVWLPNTKEE